MSALITGIALLLALVAIAAATTPWRTFAGLEAAPELDFTPADVDRERAFHRDVRPLAYLSLLLSTASAAVLGFTHLGAHVVSGVAAGHWWLGAGVGGLLCALVPAILTVGVRVFSERVMRRYGLSNQDWASWLSDRARQLALSVVLLPVMIGLVWLGRLRPGSWWVIAGLSAAALSVVLSFLYPLVIEPIFNRFCSLEPGPLRTTLLELAAADDVHVKDVLIADASRRTTALNAYVSGIGSSRRVVVYDTLIAAASDAEVSLVIAHELGHVKHRDVARGTMLAALGACGAAALLGAALGSSWLQGIAGFSGPGDPRSVAAVLALATIGSTATGPVFSLMSRAVEGRADLHSLELTEDPTTFIEVERKLALRNLASLGTHDMSYWLFATHPSVPDRIAFARRWSELRVVAG